MSAFSRYGPKFFLQVVKKLTPDQRSVVVKFGFGCLLMFDCCSMPSDFCRWVAHSVDAVCSQISVGGKHIGISKETFHVVLGLPIGGQLVPSNSEDGTAFLLSLFKLSEVPNITFFASKLSSGDTLSELEVFVCFMSVAFSCFLCPDTRQSVNTKFIGILKDPAAVKGYDLSLLVYDHCLSFLREFNSFCKLKGRRMKGLVCCMYVPVVRYLDCLDFGTQTVCQSTPRVRVWRGNMIHLFSELDRTCRKQFGKKQLKDFWTAGHHLNCSGSSHTNSASRISPTVSPLSVVFRTKAHEQFATSLHPAVIDGIISIGDNFLSSKSPTGKRKLEVFVQNVLDFMRTSSNMQGKRDENLRASDGNNVNSPHIRCPNVNTDPGPSRAEVDELQQKAPSTNQEVANLSSPAIKRTPDPVTPDCSIIKVVEGLTHPSAPAMAPLKKVRARNFQGTVPVIDVPESPRVEPQTGDFNLNRSDALQQNGSKKTPIRIPDSSPKPTSGVNDGVVHLVGSTDFRRRRHELSNNADTTYNNMMLTNQQRLNGVSTTRVNVNEPQGNRASNDTDDVPRRVVRVKYKFVNWLVSCMNPPLQSNTRFPLSREEIIDYSAIVELAHGPHNKTAGIFYPKVHCSYQSLGKSLMPNGEIDNFIIPCYCRVLFEERHPTSSGRHYFFPHVGDAILKYDGNVNYEQTVRTSFEGARSASKSRNLGHKDNLLVFPIVTTGHWFGFAVDFQEKVFAFLDSYFDEHSPFHLPIKDRLIGNFIRLWELIINTNHNFAEFQAIYPEVPQQKNEKDCGVFVMKLMEIWKPNIETRAIFSHRDILNIRILLALKLFFHSKNEADLSLVTDFYAAG